MNSAREKALRFCEAVVPSIDGDAAFEDVTQGRQGPGYSACGDLAHAVLAELGLRDRSIVNRDVDDLRYVSQQNVSKLYNGAIQAGLWQHYAAFRVPQPGDIVLIGRYSAGEPEHLLVFRSLEETEFASTWWRSYDYGQVDEATGKASSTICNRKRVGNRLDGREILGWVDLDRVARLLAS